MTMQEILQKAIELDAADIFLVAGLPVTFKCGGHQERSPEGFLRPDDINTLVDSVYEISRRSRTNLESGIDDDFSFAVPQLGRFRVNVFRQRGSLAAVIRVIRFGLPEGHGSIPETQIRGPDLKRPEDLVGKRAALFDLRFFLLELSKLLFGLLQLKEGLFKLRCRRQDIPCGVALFFRTFKLLSGRKREVLQFPRKKLQTGKEVLHIRHAGPLRPPDAFPAGGKLLRRAVFWDHRMLRLRPEGRYQLVNGLFLFFSPPEKPTFKSRSA